MEAQSEGQRVARWRPGGGDASQSPGVAHGNYVLSFEGYKPSTEELAAVVGGLPNVDSTSLPVLPDSFPSLNLVPNSERYIVGPASLQKFDSGIPPSVAAFRLGAEAEYGVFHGPKGDAALALFNYPTNQMAMERLGEFSKLPGAVTKRAGPMVAILLSPPDPDEAERLLSKVRWEAAVTRDERVPTARDNIGSLMVNIFVLTGIVMAFSLVAGLFVGGFRRVLLRGRKGVEGDAMITLHLENRRS